MKPVSRLNAGFFAILVFENDFDFRRRGNVWKNQVPYAGSRHRLPKPLACPNALVQMRCMSRYAAQMRGLSKNSSNSLPKQLACPNSGPVQTLGLSKLWACPKAEKTTPTPEAGGNSVLSHKVLYRVCKNSLSSQQFGQAKPKVAEVNFGQANCLGQTVWTGKLFSIGWDAER